MKQYRDGLFVKDELKGQTFESCEFIKCRFANASFRFTSFKKCIFQTCDLSSNIFDVTTFSGCSFPESKLSNLDFTQTHLEGCDFKGAIMKYCVFQSMKPGSTFQRKKMDLKTCTFKSADLTGSVFNHCDLSCVSFSGANLESTVFEACFLKEANLSGASIQGTNFTLSKLDHTVLDIDGFIAFGNSKGFVLGG